MPRTGRLVTARNFRFFLERIENEPKWCDGQTHVNNGSRATVNQWAEAHGPNASDTSRDVCPAFCAMDAI